MTDPKAPEDFAGWNEQMIQRHDPETFYRHPIAAVRWVESTRVKAVIRGLNLKPDCRLLDAGCGAGLVGTVGATGMLRSTMPLEMA